MLETRRPNTSENVVLILMAMVAGLAAGDRLAFNILAPLIVADLQMTNAHVGYLTAAFSCAYGLSAVLIGYWFRKTRSRKAVLIGCILLFSLAMALGGMAGSLLALAFTRVVVGIGEGPVLPFAQTMMFQASSEKRRGFNTGMTQAFGGFLVGGFVAPLALSWLAGEFGWRGAFIGFAVPGLLLAMLLAAVLHVEDRAVAADIAGDGDPVGLEPVAGAGRNIWLCTLVGIGMTTLLIVQSAFLPLYLTNLRGFSFESMAMVMSITGIGGASGAIIMPWLADRYGRRPIITLACLLACLAPLGALYSYDTLAILMPMMLVGWIAVGVCGVYMITVPAESSRPINHTLVFGALMCASEIVGAVIAPGVAGGLADSYGLQIPLWIAIAGALWAAVISLFLKETLRRKEPVLNGLSAA